MNIDVPKYTGNGFEFVWDTGYSIRCLIKDESAIIEANAEGLRSLARHLLELSQESVPEYCHFHLDVYNALEDDSSELIIVKKINKDTRDG